MLTMNRNTTVIVLCGLLLLTDVLWVERMIEIRDHMSNTELAMLVMGQVLLVVFSGSIARMVLRKKYSRQKKPFRTERGFAVLRPVRLLFVSVSS